MGTVSGLFGGRVPVRLSQRLPMDVRARERLVIPMHLVNLAQVSGCAFVALAAVHSVTFAVGRRIGRYNVVDVAWGMGFVAIAAVAAIIGHGDPTGGGCCWHSCRSGVCG